MCCALCRSIRAVAGSGSWRGRAPAACPVPVPIYRASPSGFMADASVLVAARAAPGTTRQRGQKRAANPNFALECQRAAPCAGWRRSCGAEEIGRCLRQDPEASGEICSTSRGDHPLFNRNGIFLMPASIPRPSRIWEERRRAPPRLLGGSRGGTRSREPRSCVASPSAMTTAGTSRASTEPSPRLLDCSPPASSCQRQKSRANLQDAAPSS